MEVTYDGKSLILGCASTGAKFTPANHKPTGDNLLDEICVGSTIKNSAEALLAEADALYSRGCRYYHYHARNPNTHEQTTSNEVYQKISRELQRRCKDMLISFGASRNGAEVRESIGQFGEWERLSQCSLPFHLGGAHFVTIQSAVELQLMCELERQFGEWSFDTIESPQFGEAVLAYQPSDQLTESRLDTYSTSKGADYGRTSPLIQFEVYRSAIEARDRLGLFHEVEWVQAQRSYAMSRYAVEHPLLRLGHNGQINVTLLFGFSPRLPFPRSYTEFKRVVNAAKNLEHDLTEPGVKQRHVTITVGAAVLPQQAEAHFIPLDVGPRAGQRACALRRLVSYASQPDSCVDILRFGMEDSPYTVSRHGEIGLADNCDLAEVVLAELAANGARVETDHQEIFERLGLHWVRRSVLLEQRRRPLGRPVDRRLQPV
ncbi:3-keto-5-aminohexanoate cleavage protein [Amycolatopsis sp. BJA-103]|uniref:3-keto-5-aminohexanoate cleavage protein n=1 Tax=Amycolatopsis sp. BJA-103 TaxID=1911175 RepID=UPI000C784253|nr:3-keto-5-aminohexanoate cleavage protein [Amycolatopsis sp. BJA-103]AUI60371.1 hypothetical protein BKN51_20685 [Amycolatopsis sp. BJA-103]PNE16396.1 hypothetical protein B1H26_24305 [Amycolatopsis sp. BJA-103]